MNLLPDARRCIAGRTKAVDDVVLLLIKPMRERLPALRDRLSQCIPVTVPALVAVAMTDGPQR